MNKQQVMQIDKLSIKMIKNEGNTLPLACSGSLAVIGELALYLDLQSLEDYNVSSQGSRSLFEELAIASHLTVGITYARGYSLESDVVDEQITIDAIDTANDCDSVIILAGTTADAKLPENQLYLIERLVALGKSIVFVLLTDTPAEFLWIKKADCVLTSTWGEHETARVLAELAFGKV